MFRQDCTFAFIHYDDVFSEDTLVPLLKTETAVELDVPDDRYSEVRVILFGIFYLSRKVNRAKEFEKSFCHARTSTGMFM